MNKVQFDDMPLVIEVYDLQGRVAIRWDIEQITTPENDMMPSKTMYECYQAIAENSSREAVITAIIRSRYTPDAEFAIHRKIVANESGAQAEFDDYNTFVKKAKSIANSIQP